MKRRIVLISALLLVTLLVDCAMLFLPGARVLDLTWSLRCSSITDALFVAQFVLLAIWAGLARGPLPWRLSGMLAGIALCVILWPRTGDFESFSFGLALFTSVLSIQVVHIAAILVVARCCGVGLELYSNEDSHESSHLAKPKYQFSLRYLLWWTTGLAVLLSMVRCIAIYAEDYGHMPEIFVVWWRDNSPLLISIALFALTVVWATLGNQWLVLRVIVLVAAVAAATAVEIWPTPQSSLLVSPSFFADWLYLVTFCYLPFTAWLTGSLLVFRIIGYRIVWCRPIWWVAGARRSGAPGVHDS